MKKVVLAAVMFLSVSLKAQTCFEGNCVEGFGKSDAQGYFYVGSFYDSKFDGPGLRYSKTNGAITISYYAAGSQTITIVEFASGNLEFGYRRKSETTGNNVLYNGFIFKEDGLSKYVDGRKYPLDFDFKSNACLIGNCQSGFGAEYMAFVTDDKDTVSYLFVGNYKEGDWDGEGGYYEFQSGDFFVGKFLAGEEWTGGIYNHDDGLATFMVDGEEMKTMSYTIPEFQAPTNTTSANNTSTTRPQNSSSSQNQRGGFWRAMGEVAGGVIAGMAEASTTSRSNSTNNSQGSKQVKIFISNKTYKQIDELYLSSSNTESWEEDILGDNVFTHGQGDWISFATSGCTYDLKVVYKSGNSEVFSGLNVCQYKQFELIPGGKVNMRAN